MQHSGDCDTDLVLLFSFRTKITLVKFKKTMTRGLQKIITDYR